MQNELTDVDDERAQVSLIDTDARLSVVWDDSTTNLNSDEYTFLSIAITNNIHLLPRWCSTLLITFDMDNDVELDGAYATMETSVAYRHAKLTTLSPFFELDEDGAESIIVHEFMHVAVEQSVSMACDVVDNFDGPKHIRAYLQRQIVENVESVVTDLTDIILRDRKVCKAEKWTQPLSE